MRPEETDPVEFPGGPLETGGNAGPRWMAASPRNAVRQKPAYSPTPPAPALTSKNGSAAPRSRPAQPPLPPVGCLTSMRLAWLPSLLGTSSRSTPLS
jgi:hypothetical protein